MQNLSASNTLYVVRVLERMRQEEKATWALGLLTSYCRQQVSKLGRRYPDGLVKYEPKDLHSLNLPRLRTTNNGRETLEAAVSQLVAGNSHSAFRIADRFFEFVPHRLKRKSKGSIVYAVIDGNAGATARGSKTSRRG